jgi:hypothetical protein
LTPDPARPPAQVTEESSKWIYNSDDEDDGGTDYGMANEMDV